MTEWDRALAPADKAGKTRKPRPKVVAAGGTTTGATVVAYLLRLCGVDVDDVPAEVLVAAAGGLATLAAYVRRDGLSGAWERLVRGELVE